VERPVLAMRVLLILQSGNKNTLSDMVKEGWNRRTTEASLKKATSLGLVESHSEGSFPRFMKTYSLTGAGEYIARFVRLLEKQAGKCLKDTDEDFCRIPKGCLVILAYMSRKRFASISTVLVDLEISPSQLYRCLAFMNEKGIVTRGERRRESEISTAYILTEAGASLATISNGLDMALKSVVIDRKDTP